MTSRYLPLVERPRMSTLGRTRRNSFLVTILAQNGKDPQHASVERLSRRSTRSLEDADCSYESNPAGRNLDLGQKQREHGFSICQSTEGAFTEGTFPELDEYKYKGRAQFPSFLLISRSSLHNTKYTITINLPSCNSPPSSALSS
jgi:hypothetical protein